MQACMDFLHFSAHSIKFHTYKYTGKLAYTQLSKYKISII